MNLYFVHAIDTIKKSGEALRTQLNLHQGRVPLYTVDSKPYGLSMGDWTAKWWQWVASNPQDKNPANDNSSAGIYQQPDYPLYFLTGGYNAALNRTVTIPADKGIMFPVFNTEVSSYKANIPSVAEELQLRAYAQSETYYVTYLGAELDGKPLPYYRVIAPLFVQFLPENNLFGVHPNDNSINKFYSVGDGYYVFLDPLPEGKHTIHLKGVAPDYSTEVTYNVNVVDMPSKPIDHKANALTNLEKGISMLNLGNISDGDYHFQQAQQELSMMSDQNKYRSFNLTALEHSQHALNFLRAANVTLSIEHAQDTINSLTGKGMKM